MKKLCVLFSLALISYCNSVSYSQELSAGLLSGINISDIHGNDNSGKWKFKPGSYESIFVNYNLNRVIGFQSGLSFSSLYYEHLPYVDRTELPEIELNAYPIMPVQYPYNKKMDFTFLTIPLQFRISVPSTPQLNISAGVFYSFLVDHSLNYYSGQKPEKNDFGFLFSTGISYPLTRKINALLDFGYMTGRKKLLEDYDYRHGSMNIAFGISYDGFLKDRPEWKREEEELQSQGKIDLIYRAGISFTWNSSSLNPDIYKIALGPSLGFGVDFSLSNRFSLQTGITFEKNGYSLRDSSDSFDRYINEGDPEYFVDTKTGIDYIIIPALVNLSFGSKYRLFLSTGPYAAIKINSFCSGKAYSAINSGSGFRMEETVVSDDIGWMIKDSDFGWIAGGGITMPVTERLKIDFGLQYNKGFRDVGRPEYSSEGYEVEKGMTLIRNNSVSFQVGLRVPVN